MLLPLAPEVVEFYNADWVEIGTKSSLKATLYEITGIDIRVLEGAPPSVCNVAHRLSWASTRRTTRVEDMAYSLLGLFDINMPLLYGEGTNAFKRLQEEILKNLKDYTLFAWRDHDGLPLGDGILAPSPANFCRPKNCLACSGLTAWTYKDLLLRPFSDVNESRQVDSQLSEGSLMMADSADLPTFMVGRLRMSLPISYLADHQNIDGTHKPGPAKTMLAYLGYRNGKNGDLLCLQLGPDWEFIHDFYRGSLVQVAKAHITHFRLNTVVLVSWRNITAESKTNLREVLKYQFVYGPLPPCLSILYDHFPESQRPGISNPPSLSRHLFTGIQSKDGVTLHNGTWAISLFKHEHVGLEGQAECVEMQFGLMFNMPMCAMKIKKLNDFPRLYPKWAIERIEVGLVTDRVKVLGCSGRHILFASAKRQPTTDPSVPRFAVQIVCGVTEEQSVSSLCSRVKRRWVKLHR